MNKSLSLIFGTMRDVTANGNTFVWTKKSGFASTMTLRRIEQRAIAAGFMRINAEFTHNDAGFESHLAFIGPEKETLTISANIGGNKDNNHYSAILKI
jgi:hypothetical protein